uniref:Transcriptional repressor n=1 Tax=Ganoderma boninense TaxID=34458 RepID=A0A5K1K8A7_9APHY|nr:Putative transcriptional repressor [Ganoderma boninense]
MSTPGATSCASEPASSSLLSLPVEVVERILTTSDPRDVARFAQTCRYAHKLVYEPDDQFLWRELYLGHPFDDLRKAVHVPKGQRTVFTNAEIEGAQMPQDSASSTVDESQLQWRSELQRRIQAEIVAGSGTRDARRLQAAYEAFLSAIETAAPATSLSELDTGLESKSADGKATGRSDAAAPLDSDAARSENIHWVDRILRKTKLLDLVPAYTGAIVDIPSLEDLQTPTSSESESAVGSSSHAPGDSEKTLEQAAKKSGEAQVNDAYDASDVCWIPEHFRQAHQLRSRLRAYVALAHESSFNGDSRARMDRLRRASRTFVYDMRKYRRETLWGPFRTAEDGRTVIVDWEHVEHILNVVGLKLREVPLSSLGFYKKPLFQLDALLAGSMVGVRDLPQGDWAGVTGPHDPSFFDDPFDEALRPVELHLTLISPKEYFSEPHRIPIDPSVSVSSLEAKAPGKRPIADCDDPAFPTLYFKGDSHGAAATVRGKVSVLSDGTVRWQFEELTIWSAYRLRLMTEECSGVPKVFSWATLAARQGSLGSGPGLTMIEVLPVVRLMELDADPLRR